MAGTSISKEELLERLGHDKWQETGYPQTLMLDEWMPTVQTLLDEGLAVWSVCCLGNCLKLLKI